MPISTDNYICREACQQPDYITEALGRHLIDVTGRYFWLHLVYLWSPTDAGVTCVQSNLRVPNLWITRVHCNIKLEYRLSLIIWGLIIPQFCIEPNLSQPEASKAVLWLCAPRLASGGSWGLSEPWVVASVGLRMAVKAKEHNVRFAKKRKKKLQSFDLSSNFETCSGHRWTLWAFRPHKALRTQLEQCFWLVRRWWAQPLY